MTWRTRLAAIERCRPPGIDNGCVAATLAMMFRATVCGPGSPYERLSDEVLCGVFADRPGLHVAATRLDTFIRDKGKRAGRRSRQKGNSHVDS